MKKDEFKEIDEENHEEKKKTPKGLIMAIAGISSIILIVLIFFGVRYFNEQKMIKQADSFIAIEKFEDGIYIYDNLLSKKYSLEIINKRSAAVELMEADENLKKGVEAYEENDINRAVRHLLKVPKEDEKRYKLALEELALIESDVLAEIERLIDYEDLDEAKEVANNYLKSDPKNVKVQNVKNAIDSQQAESEKQARMEKENQEAEALELANKAEREAEDARKKAEARNEANNIVGSYKSIIAENANLRDTPSLKGGVILVLPRGTNVYIHETQIENEDRIWCYVSVDDYDYYESGWISYNTLNYNIQ